VWQRGLDAFACYLSPPPAWKLTEARKRPLRSLLAEAPERGEEALAQLVHGYMAAHRRVTNGWDPLAYLKPDTILRAGKRQERWEAYDAALASGLSPPFRPVYVEPKAAESFDERQQREFREYVATGKLPGRENGGTDGLRLPAGRHS
jgi:hypothetical protein